MLPYLCILRLRTSSICCKVMPSSMSMSSLSSSKRSEKCRGSKACYFTMYILFVIVI